MRAEYERREMERQAKLEREERERLAMEMAEKERVAKEMAARERKAMEAAEHERRERLKARLEKKLEEEIQALQEQKKRLEKEERKMQRKRRREPSVVRSEGKPSTRREEGPFRGEEMGNAEFADAVEKILMWSTSATQAQRDLEEQFRRRIERHQKQRQQVEHPRQGTVPRQRRHDQQGRHHRSRRRLDGRGADNDTRDQTLLTSASGMAFTYATSCCASTAFGLAQCGRHVIDG